MSLITTGLANSGLTTHYQIQYDDSLSQADGPDRANALIAACEADYDIMSGWFGGIALTVGTPVTVNIVPGPGASAGWGPPITLQPGDGSSLTLVRYLLVSEVTEMFMLAQFAGWFAPDGSNEQSCGEALSRFLAQQFLVSTGSGVSEPGFELAPSWLDSSLPPISPIYGSRSDFINVTREYDHGIDPSTGCSILFIYYLFTQLNFSINSIIAAAPGVAGASTCLRGVFENLTGEASDPFPLFLELLDTAFPPGVPATIPGPNPDNPWPLGPSGTQSIQATLTRTDPVGDFGDRRLPVVTDLLITGFGFTPAGEVSGPMGVIVADVWGAFSWGARVPNNPRFRGSDVVSVTDVLTGVVASTAIQFVEG